MDMGYNMDEDDIFVNGTGRLVAEAPEYKIGQAITLYALPFIITSGVIGNLLSFLVATRPQNRKLPFGIYIAALAMADTAFLLLGQLHGWIMFHLLPELMSKSQCILLLYLFSSAANVSTWTIVALTVERYLCVCKATTSLKWRTPKISYIALCAIVTICLLKSSHYLISAEFWRDEDYSVMFCSTALTRSDWPIIILQVCDLCFNSLLPFGIILALNSFIINRLRAQSKFHAERLKRSTTTSSTGSLIPVLPRDAATGITNMLLVVSLAFILFTAPIYIFRFVYAFVKSPTAYLMAMYTLVDNILGVLYASNFAANFYLYCLTGTMFRQDLKKMIRDVIPSFHVAQRIKNILKRKERSESHTLPKCISMNPLPDKTGSDVTSAQKEEDMPRGQDRAREKH